MSCAGPSPPPENHLTVQPGALQIQIPRASLPSIIESEPRRTAAGEAVACPSLPPRRAPLLTFKCRLAFCPTCASPRPAATLPPRQRATQHARQSAFGAVWRSTASSGTSAEKRSAPAGDTLATE